MPRVWLELSKDPPPFLDEKLKQGLVGTFGVFEGSLHLGDASLDELDVRGITCSGRGRSHCASSVEGVGCFVKTVATVQSKSRGNELRFAVVNL